MAVPESGTTSRKTSASKSPRTKTNVTAKLLTEIQALIAYACYDSPSISCGAKTMTEIDQAKLMANLCFGNIDDDPEIMCYVDQFLHGLNKFHGLFNASSVEIQPGGSPNAPEMLLTMIPILHQMGQETNIFVGKGSIEKSLLMSKSVGRASSISNVTGRTLLRAAKDVLCNCKKLTAIVTASNSPYKDGNFPSGTNWDDYIYWCLAAMKKAVVEKAVLPGEKAAVLVAEKPPPVQVQRVVGDAAARNTGDCVMLSPHAVTEDSNVPIGKEEPDGTFFKGFMAWCLWGHIPILVNDVEMKSIQFTDTKVGTGHGRNTGSRRALKANALLLQQDGDSNVDNRRGQSSSKKQKRGSPNDDNEGLTMTSFCGDDDTATNTTVAGADDDRILKQALDYLDSESLEKARQKHSMLSCLRIRDEISSLKGQVDSVSRRFYHAQQGTPQAESLMEKMDSIEATMREREELLSILQRTEADRQLKVIAERAANRAAAAAAADSHRQSSSFTTTEPPQDDGTSSVVLSTTPVKRAPPSGVVTFPSPMKSPAEAMLAIASQEVLVCVECTITPTRHKCRRCKRYVCDVCCSTQRGLEMIWWCAACFDNESVSNQETIRQGNYESDGDSIS
ncbi:hypothetical protein MHU86_4372 [Fragilaria crotonensis]|nr:hypothetical protein MHU86_4372 [Fragilaria crotonensis]